MIRSMRSSSSSATATSDEPWPSGWRSSRWPRAIVTGVRSSCVTSWRKRSCLARSVARLSASASDSWIAATRRRACQTIARNIADMSGTSKSSPQSWMPANASARIDPPVVTTTAARISIVTCGDQTRKPNRSVRLIQTKWNGIVSQLGHAIIAPMFAAAKAAHPTSTECLRDQAITGMSNRLDRGVGAELLAQPPHADVDDVGAGVEAIPPDVGE